MHKYPELKKLHALQGLDNIFAGAVHQLKSVESSEALYVKILHPKDETSQLNRNRSGMYAAAATACAQFENSTFLNYFTTDNEAHVKLSESIKKYLGLRQKLIVIAAGDHSKEAMGETESIKFLEKAVIDFEKEESDTLEQSENPLIYRGFNLNL